MDSVTGLGRAVLVEARQHVNENYRPSAASGERLLSGNETVKLSPKRALALVHGRSFNRL
jgi:hypothetical protein